MKDKYPGVKEGGKSFSEEGGGDKYRFRPVRAKEHSNETVPVGI
jgi:hypothetical protein